MLLQSGTRSRRTAFKNKLQLMHIEVFLYTLGSAQSIQGVNGPNNSFDPTQGLNLRHLAKGTTDFGFRPMDSPSQISFDAELWDLAEQRAEEIICCVQPTRVADEKREEVLAFLRDLIGQKCGSEIFPFGSMPLRVYLPDGDIDITALIPKSREGDLAKDLVRLLESPQHSGVSVCDVQYIRAQVEIVKCTINEIAVDISFNQLAGLSTLCFLEKVNQHIGKNHLFKRSIILIKSWCFYESRILGAHHGCLSTYGLEVLVLYIINCYHSTLHGPLAVLHRFLEYYSEFDWENYAVSINGPVSKSLLSGAVVPEKPQSDGDQLLLSEEFLQTCRDMFKISAGEPDIGEKIFPIKFFNIVDPLKDYNNLARSVGEGNSYRIKCALNLGLRKLNEILMHPGERMVQRLEYFFLYTLDRNGRGQRPDAEVPVSAFGTRKFEVSDLDGDFDKYYGWLLHSQQYHKNIDLLSHRSTPPSPFLVRDGIAMPTHFQPLLQYQNALYFEGTDNFVPRVPPHYFNRILPGTAGYLEEMQKSQGAVTYIPAGYLEEMQNSQGAVTYIPAGYLEEMQNSQGAVTYIPSATQLMYRDTHSIINPPLNDARYWENMQRSRGTGTYIPNMGQLKYRETHSCGKHPSRGTGTYIPSITQPTYRKTRSSVQHPSGETLRFKAANLSPRHYMQTRHGSQSSYKEKLPSNDPSDREMSSTSKEQNLAAVTCSESQNSQKGSGDIAVLSKLEKNTVGLSLNEFAVLQDVANTSAESSQSDLPDVHQTEQFSTHSETIKFGSMRNALSSEPPFPLIDQLAISSPTTAVDSIHTGPSRKNQNKTEGPKPKAKPYNSSIPKASYSPVSTGSDVSKRGMPNTKGDMDQETKGKLDQETKGKRDQEAKPYRPWPLENNKEFPPLSRAQVSKVEKLHKFAHEGTMKPAS